MKHPLKNQQRTEIEDCIAAAEKTTSGEIRIFIEEKCPGNVLDRAAFIFQKLNMHRTRLRNGVLIYVSYADKNFAIIGDAGIHAKLKEGFWEETAAKMKEKFSGDNLKEGFLAAIQSISRELAQHFPLHPGDKNELPDSIVFGKGPTGGSKNE